MVFESQLPHIYVLVDEDGQPLDYNIVEAKKDD